MIVYILMLLISLIFLILANKVEKKWLKILMYILSAIPFFLVSAFRYDVGTDYMNRYWRNYNEILNDKPVRDLEIGFMSLIRLCLFITNKPYILFIICSAVIIGLIMYTIITKSKNPVLSVFIFFLGGFFFDSLNIMRQYMAMSLVLFGYNFLLENRKIVLYVLCVLLASTLHSSALIMLVLIFLPYKAYANWKWVLPIALAVLLLNEKLFDIIGFALESTRFKTYFTGKFAKGEISYLLIAENLLFFIFMSYIYAKNKKLGKIDKQDKLFLNIQAISLFTIVLATCHMLFIRISLYFSIFQVISIPYYISKMQVEEITKDLKRLTRNKINIIEKYLQTCTTIVIVLCFIFAFIRTNILTNTNEVVPYKTIINKNWTIK